MHENTSESHLSQESFLFFGYGYQEELAPWGMM